MKNSAEPEWLQTLDHTADAGVIVRAGTLEELFARAGWAMFSLIADMDSVRAEETTQVGLEAADLQALLVRWLSELNYRHITEHRLFCDFQIQKISATDLRAIVTGEEIDPKRHTIFTEIKAITFHGLQISRDNGLWKVQIIFDL